MQGKKSLITEVLGMDFLSAVEGNTAIADALSAGDYTLCTYLMKMREYYRWQNRIPFEEKLDSEALGYWIRQTESHWDDIEENSFGDLPLAGTLTPPLETSRINEKLLPLQLVYSAGIGHNGKIHFFLAKLVSQTEFKDFQVFVSSEEYVRDLVSPVAMTLGKTIFVRKQALQRLIWERVQENAWHGAPTPLAKSLSNWNFNANVDDSLQEAADHFLQLFIAHEIGEVRAGILLGSEWEEILSEHLGTKTELQLRAVRDCLADFLVTLPELLKTNDSANIHFYFGMLSPLRKNMLTALLQSYDRWCEDPNPKYIADVVAHQTNRWKNLSLAIIERHQKSGTNSRLEIDQLLEQHLEQF